MRKSRPLIFWLMIVMSVTFFAAAVYLPVLVAWMNRDKGDSEEGVYVSVQSSWFMRRAAFLYVPLTKFHASMYGYYYYMTFNDGEDMVFSRSPILLH